MSRAIPAIVIAGTSSGVGKTSLTLGIVRALSRRGLRVQPFKVGPDFLDPTYLTRAAGRPCYNLDGWMSDRSYVEQLFARAAGSADVAIVEGVMGMFDGSDPTDNSGSTGEIAAWLDAGVVLVVNSHGLARTIAPLVKGFVEFDPAVRVVGIVANHAGSDRHREWMSDALAAENLPPLLGAVPRESLPTLPSRHLGLVSADAESLSEDQVDALADACEQYLDLDAILKAAGAVELQPTDAPAPNAKPAIRIGVGRDAAFHFAYQDNLEALTAAGAEMVPFSPLADAQLPADLAGVYLPGGYPELYAEALAANETMRQSIREFGESGGVIYGECGGLMYLGRAIRNDAGDELPMVGLIPIVTRKLERLRTLGYVEVTMRLDTPWGRRGETIRGHEFHYSTIVSDELESAGWQKVYDLRRRRSDAVEAEGFRRANILASYVHLHWASRPDAASRFVDHCRNCVK